MREILIDEKTKKIQKEVIAGWLPCPEILIGGVKFRYLSVNQGKNAQALHRVKDPPTVNFTWY